MSPRYAELGAATNFSFLRGASHPEEMIERAAELGLAGIGVADRNSLAGAVRAHAAWREWRGRVEGAPGGPSTAGLRYLVGCRLVLCDGTPDLLAFPRDRAAYGRLTRLLTRGNARAPKGLCRLTLKDVLAFHEGIQFIILPAATLEPDERADLAAHARKGAAPTELSGDEDGEGPGNDDPALEGLLAAAPGRVWLGMAPGYGPSPRRRMAARRRA
jgi:error-prone DNA polymerase